jgi:hypothetical protein
MCILRSDKAENCASPYYTPKINRTVLLFIASMRNANFTYVRKYVAKNYNPWI